jgi:hypothetical protein
MTVASLQASGTRLSVRMWLYTDGRNSLLASGTCEGISLWIPLGPGDVLLQRFNATKFSFMVKVVL